MSTRTELQQEATELREQAERLEQRIKELPEAEGRWKPSQSEKYYYVSSDGGLGTTSFYDKYPSDVGQYALGNCFKTPEEAELHKLRLESMANRSFAPSAGQYYWTWAFNVGRAKRWCSDNGVKQNAGLYSMGNLHPTEEAAQAWHDKYGKAWEALLK
jgi:hypothetical protein